MIRRLLAVGVLGCAVAVSADAPLAPPAPITRCSANRRYCAVADPTRNAVTVYRVVGTARTELWAVTPWQRVFDVADNGDHMVACFSGVNLLPLDYRPDETMLHFYKRGESVRAWSLRDLVPDRGKMKRTISHYEWGHCAGFNALGLYEVRTADRGTLRFDVRTGNLVK